MIIPALTGEKLDKISRKNIHIFVQNEAVIGKKPVPGVCETSNSSHKQIISWQEKNLKIIFSQGSGTL